MLPDKQCNLTIDFLYKVKTAQNGPSTDESTFPPEAAKRKSSSTTNLKSKVLLNSEGLQVEPKKVFRK